MVLANPTIIPKLFKLLGHEKRSIRKDVCWALSNITAGSESHVQIIIGNSTYLNQIITVCILDSSKDVIMAVYCFLNV